MPITASQLNILGAQLAENEIVFTNGTTDENHVCVLNSRGVIAIKGPDAEKFMQGQLTCDLNKITLEQSALGAHCSPKGRAIASFRLVKVAEQHYLFGLPHNNAETLLKSLGKYIVFSKAKLSAVDSICALGLSGKPAANFVADIFGTLLNAHDSTTNASGTAICIGENRFELWLNKIQLEALWPQIIAIFTPSDTNAWYSANVNAQLAEIEAATSDELIPQMFKLDQHGGISFTKGCYTGQEIVARLKYLGKQKRQMLKFSHNDDSIKVGDTVAGSEGNKLGIVVTVANTSGLAVVSDKALSASQASINTAPIQFDHDE